MKLMKSRQNRINHGFSKNFQNINLCEKLIIILTKNLKEEIFN